MANREKELKDALTNLEKAESSHPDAEIKNKNRLNYLSETNHNIAIAKALTSLIQNFSNNTIVAIIEAEILSLGYRSNPEDILLWIEDIGLFVVEIKSHTIDGIRSFENNVPQIVYKGKTVPDTHIIDQPKTFAFNLRGDIELLFEKHNLSAPALYYAGWLPNISPEEIIAMDGNIDDSKIWLSDMLDRDVFIKRLDKCRNITRGEGAPRESLDIIIKSCFGCSAGLRTPQKKRQTSTTPGSLAYLIAERENQLKRLTKEQEDIIHHEHLLTGPKVIRGVAGSGKTIVLANVVADLLVNQSEGQTEMSFVSPKKILVLCFNRALVVLLREHVVECFQRRKRKSGTKFPTDILDIVNIDQMAMNAAREKGINFDINDKDRGKRAAALVKNKLWKGRYDYIFIDEGQDIDLDWFKWIRFTALNHKSAGPSIIVFYDDAQNIYGSKRPGTSNVPPWKELLGGDVYSRGLRTIMRVGHRNTNHILTFSFSLLLGAYADKDPMMATFADINSYKEEKIPADPLLQHPNAGKPCIEEIGNRSYRINFALHDGPFPKVNIITDYNIFWEEYIDKVKFLIDPVRGNILPSDILIMANTRENIVTVSQHFKSAGIKYRIAHKERDSQFFQDDTITLSTIQSAKGYTAHVCHLLFVDRLEQPGKTKRIREQKERAKLHVACTRSKTSLELFGTDCPFMTEAKDSVRNLSP